MSKAEPPSEPGWYPNPKDPQTVRWWNGKRFEGDPRPLGWEQRYRQRPDATDDTKERKLIVLIGKENPDLLDEGEKIVTAVAGGNRRKATIGGEVPGPMALVAQALLAAGVAASSKYRRRLLILTNRRLLMAELAPSRSWHISRICHTVDPSEAKRAMSFDRCHGALVLNGDTIVPDSRVASERLVRLLLEAANASVPK